MRYLFLACLLATACATPAGSARVNVTKVHDIVFKILTAFLDQR